MICSQCQHDNAANERYCTRCGKSLVGGPKLNWGCLVPVIMLAVFMVLSLIVYILVRDSAHTTEKLIGPSTRRAGTYQLAPQTAPVTTPTTDQTER